jgi:hypothetical protein
MLTDETPEEALARMGYRESIIFVFGDNGEPSFTSVVGDAAWDTKENRKRTFEYIQRKTREATKAKNKQCIVKGCENLRYDPEKPEECDDHGLFYGEMCAPCHEFITTGFGEFSQAYRNAIMVASKMLSNAIRRVP